MNTKQKRWCHKHMYTMVIIGEAIWAALLVCFIAYVRVGLLVLCMCLLAKMDPASILRCGNCDSPHMLNCHSLSPSDSSACFLDMYLKRSLSSSSVSFYNALDAIQCPSHMRKVALCALL